MGRDSVTINNVRRAIRPEVSFVVKKDAGKPTSQKGSADLNDIESSASQEIIDKAKNVYGDLKPYYTVHKL